MCPQTPRLSPEYSHKAGLQTVITEAPLQIRPVTRSSHAGPVCNTQSCIQRIIERAPQVYVPHLHHKKRTRTPFRD
jgi:hypothetical protein